MSLKNIRFSSAFDFKSRHQKLGDLVQSPQTTSGGFDVLFVEVRGQPVWRIGQGQGVVPALEVVGVRVEKKRHAHQ